MSITPLKQELPKRKRFTVVSVRRDDGTTVNVDHVLAVDVVQASWVTAAARPEHIVLAVFAGYQSAL